MKKYNNQNINESITETEIIDKNIINKRDTLIKKIDILRLESGSTVFYINGDFKTKFNFGRGKSWDVLYQVADEGSCTINNKKYRENRVSYFNSTKNNPLYSNYGFGISKILCTDGNRIVIPENIEIKMITKQMIPKSKKS